MQNLIFLLTTSLVLSYTSSRNFKRRFISNTGCSIRIPGETFRLDKTYSETGDQLFLSSVAKGKANYGFILARLHDKITEITEAEQVLFDFMEGLLDPLAIDHTTGMSAGHEHRFTKTARGMLEYWQDDEGNDWKVKGWTNGRFMALLYVKNFTEESIKEVDEFLNSFRFRKAA